jgi:hypothetical protein
VIVCTVPGTRIVCSPGSSFRLFGRTWGEGQKHAIRYTKGRNSTELASRISKQGRVVASYSRGVTANKYERRGGHRNLRPGLSYGQRSPRARHAADTPNSDEFFIPTRARKRISKLTIGWPSAISQHCGSVSVARAIPVCPSRVHSYLGIVQLKRARVFGTSGSDGHHLPLVLAVVKPKTSCILHALLLLCLHMDIFCQVHAGFGQGLRRTVPYFPGTSPLMLTVFRLSVKRNITCIETK